MSPKVHREAAAMDGIPHDDPLPPLTDEELPQDEDHFKPARSSNIESITWTPGALAVRFKSGARYLYEGVPLEVYEKLKASPSVGTAFHRLVKMGGYAFEREATT